MARRGLQPTSSAWSRALPSASRSIRKSPSSISPGAAATLPPASTTTARPQQSPGPGRDRIYHGDDQPPGKPPGASRSRPWASASVPLRLEPRDGPGFTVADLTRRLTSDARAVRPSASPALGLSWQGRADAGATLDLPALDFGAAGSCSCRANPTSSINSWPSLRPDSFVLVVGYGESATGYVADSRAVGRATAIWTTGCWVAPGAERAMTAALKSVLGGSGDRRFARASARAIVHLRARPSGTSTTGSAPDRRARR